MTARSSEQGGPGQKYNNHRREANTWRNSPQPMEAAASHMLKDVPGCSDILHMLDLNSFANPPAITQAIKTTDLHMQPIQQASTQ
eukprot:scaffold32194_cov16-Tisochrysis_lutea.AAC.1